MLMFLDIIVSTDDNVVHLETRTFAEQMRIYLVKFGSCEAGEFACDLAKPRDWMVFTLVDRK